MSYQYASIKLGGEVTVVDHGVLVTDEGDRRGAFPAILRKNLRPLTIAIFLLGAAVVATMASSFSEGQSSAQLNTAPLIGASKGTTRSCTFDECYEANCNIKVAPFICLRNNGGPHMGCSPVAWMPGTCEDSCDLSSCDSLDIPEDTATCEGVDCGDDWCNGGQVCPSAAPYQCQNGSARFGCSADGLQWTLRSDGSTCSKCCDASLCSS